MYSMWVKHTHYSDNFGHWGPGQFGDLKSSLQPVTEVLLAHTMTETSSSLLSVEQQLLRIVLQMARERLRLIRQ